MPIYQLLKSKAVTGYGKLGKVRKSRAAGLAYIVLASAACWRQGFIIRVGDFDFVLSPYVLFLSFSCHKLRSCRWGSLSIAATTCARTPLA